MAGQGAQGRTAICSISLNMTDRIRLIGVPAQLIDGIREAILVGWGRPLQGERNYFGSHEFKLLGNPWHGQGAESVMVRRLICAILVFMARNGWNLVQSASLSKKQEDKDTMFFESAGHDPHVHIFALSFNMSDRIRLIGPAELMPYVRRTVQEHWPRGIQGERDYFGSFEMKLRGTPWYADGGDTVFARSLLNQVLATMRSLGYKLYGSIDISIGMQYTSAHRTSLTNRHMDDDNEGHWEAGYDLDSWFFRRVGPFWS